MFKQNKIKSNSFYEDFLKKSSKKKTNVTLGNIDDVIENMQKNAVSQTTIYKPKTDTSTPATAGSAIKSNIQGVLSKKYGEPDTKHLFDGISDKDIEDNIETAENAIQTNIDRGMLNKNALSKLPRLRDGLALSYAAANKGNNKAATRAREAAYTESAESLVDKVKNGLSYELPKFDNAVQRANEKPSFEKLLMTNTKSSENKRQNFDNPLLDTDISWQSNVLGNSKKADEVGPVAEKGKSEQNKNINYSPKTEYPKSFFVKSLINKNENKKHVFHAAPDYPTSYYGNMDATNDLTSGEYSRNNLLKLGGISEKDLSCSEEKHINNWKNLAKLTSVGEMQSVNLGLIDHFVEGTGSDYSNATLTKAVKEHSETKRYMSDFSKVFDAQLQLHNGNVSAFADSDDFHTAL